MENSTITKGASRNLTLGRAVQHVKSATPRKLYRVIRFSWHSLTGAVDRVGLHRLAWRWRLPTEVAHWEMWLRSRGLKQPEDFANRLKPELPLQAFLRQLLPAECTGRQIRVLDVGAGPLTTVGKTVDGKRIELVPIDPLAPVYDALLKATGVDPPVRTIFGEAEKIDQDFPENSFDLVTAVNALDHAHDPAGAIEASVRVLKPGGYMYLDHQANEGEREGYGGLHQWNFSVQNECFTISNKANQTTNITQSLAGIANVRQTITDGQLKVYIQKSAANPGTQEREASNTDRPSAAASQPERTPA